MKKPALLLLLLANTFILWAQAPPAVEFAIEQKQVLPGEEICLSVRVQNFTDVQGMQWGMHWNPEVLEFSELTNFSLPDLDLTDFNIGAVSEGTMLMSWFTLRPPFSVSVPDQTVILDICFRVKDVPNGFYSVAFDNNLITTEIVVDPNNYDDQVVKLPQMLAGGVQITRPGTFSLTADLGIDESCNGNAGTITLTPVNGVAPFTYQWTGPNDFTSSQADLSGLIPGVYQVTATDDNGQMASGYFPVSIHGDPEPLPDFLLNATVNNSSCLGNTGSIVLAPNPPVDQYTFSWNTGDTTSTIDSLAAGTYRLEMTNSRGCVQVFSFTVIQEEAFADLVVLRDSLSCVTQRAEIGVLAPTGSNYSYRWSFGASSNTITVSRTGEYQLTVTTSSGCSQVYSFFVGNPQLDLLFSRIDNNLGCSDTSVSIGLAVEQPLDGLQFLWEDGTDSPQRSVQQAGTYQLRVSEGSCSRDFTFRVEQLEDGPFFYQRVNQPFSCTQNTARIGVNVSSDLNYTYQWENRPDTAATINVTDTGTYTLTINDGRCSTQETFVLTPFTQSEFAFAQRFDDQISCNPEDTAQIGLRAIPGTSYSYHWNTGDTSDLIAVTDTGFYQLTVTDGTCMDTFFFQVPLNADKEYSLLQDDITCADPIARIGISGAPDYFRLEGLSDDEMAQTFLVDSPGSYPFFVVGGERCTFREEIDVLTVNDPSAFSRIEGQLDCTGSEPAAIGLEPTMNLGESLIYTWNTGQNDPVINVSQPGTYTLSVTGNGNCFERYQFDVGTQSDNITYERIDNQLNCRDAAATIGVRNSQPDTLLYAWSNSSTAPTTEITIAGTYQLTITDPTTNCQYIETFVQEPRQIREAEIQGECTVNNLCGGQALYTALVTDGAAPFVYQWNTGQSDTLNGPGTIALNQVMDVSVTVTDATGCQVELREDAIICPPLNEFKARLYFSCTDSSEAPEGVLNAEVLSGGLPPYEYVWNVGVTDTSYFQSSIPFSAEAGSYSVSVTDATGRQQTLSFQSTGRYGCGNQPSTTLTYLAPHLTVHPDNSFRYTIRAINYAELDQSIYTIDWDPCIVQADTIRLFSPQGNQEFTDLIPLDGSFSVAMGPYSPLGNPDTITVAEVIFTPQKSGVSPFIFAINEAATDASGNALPVRPLHGSITVAGDEQLVQSGDTDNDGFIDHYDILPLGFGFAEKGPNRRRELRTGAEFGYTWGQATPGKRINYRYLDGTGNGHIDADDIHPIDRNWHSAPRNYASAEAGPELTVAGNILERNTTNTVGITLGNMTFPAEGAYGLAFTLEYDPQQIDPQTISVSFDSSWLALSGELTYVRHIPEEQQIHIALSGIDQQARTGFGAVAQLSFRLQPEAEGPVAMLFKSALLIDAAEERVPVTFGAASLAIDAVNTQRNPSLDERIRLFPNPAQDVVHIQVPSELKVHHLQVRDVSGRKVATKNSSNAISVGHLPEGMYIMYIKMDSGLAIKPFTVTGWR